MNRSPMSDDALVALLDRTMDDIARLAEDMSPDAAHHHPHRWIATAAAATLVVAGGAVAGLALAGRRATEPATPGVGTPTETAGTPAPDTLAPDIGAWPWPSGTVPDAFPSVVPEPAGFGEMTIMRSDGAPVGWEFASSTGPVGSVAGCVEYARSFDDSWTARLDTDEAPSIVYARHYDNGEWDVGIYCTLTGQYLVQVMRSAT